MIGSGIIVYLKKISTRIGGFLGFEALLVIF